jgi:hypothetical protein
MAIRASWVEHRRGWEWRRGQWVVRRRGSGRHDPVIWFYVWHGTTLMGMSMTVRWAKWIADRELRVRDQVGVDVDG